MPRRSNVRQSAVGWGALLGLALAVLCAVRPSAADQEAFDKDAPHRDDRVLVAFHDQAPAALRLTAVQRLDLQPAPDAQSPYFASLVIPAAARANGARVEDYVKALRRDPSVRVAEPDYLVSTAATPNDPSYSSMWGLHNTGQTGGVADADVDAPEAWDLTTGSSSVIVAVIDTGTDYSHPDLTANILRNASNQVVGYDYANNDADPMDDHGHGTHVAGTIGAVGNNGVGVTGVCWNVRIMPLKFLAAAGGGSISNAILCVDFARVNGAQVMNNSWGGGGFSLLLLEAIRRARTAGILFTAAAGTAGANNDENPFYPAGYNRFSDNVLSVGSTTASDALSSFSNFGARSVDLGAPGSSILSTLPGNTYGNFSGTSMATPHVSGAAALTLARFPSVGVDGLRRRLLGGTDRISALTGKSVYGRLNAARAVETDASAPAAPGNFAVTHRTPTALRLTWNAPGDDGNSGYATQYELRYSTASLNEGNFAAATPAVDVPIPAVAGAAQEFLLPGLAPGTAYFVALRALDNASNASPLSTAGPYTTATLTTDFSDDADGAGAFSGPAPWAISTEQSSSPTHAYSDSPGSAYANNLNASLTQNAGVTLGAVAPLLQFRARTDLELDRDFLVVELSADNGATWQDQLSLTGTRAWELYTVSLSGYAGQSVRVRFRLQTSSTVTGDGVWLDDIRLLSGGSYSTPFLENAEGTAQFAGAAPWAISTERSWSPTRAYSDSPGANYANDLNLALTSNSSTSLAGIAPELVFRARLALEVGWDYLVVDVSTTNGAAWEQYAAYSVSREWAAYHLPLSRFAGQNLRLRVRLLSDSSVVADGIWLDDIRLGGRPLEAVSPPLTVSGSPTSVAPGGALTASWTAPVGQSAQDWIALYRVGDPNTAFLWFQYTGGATAGNAGLTAPVQPGQYQFRYLLNNTYVDAARSATITVSATAYTVTAGATSASGGAPLSVDWTAPAGHSASDWVALVKMGDPNTAYVWWQPTGAGTSGTFNLTAPTTSGDYEFRYLLNGGYTDVARSAKVTVSGSAYSVTPGGTSATPGGALSVTWNAPAGHPATDWIALYRVGEPNTAYVWYQYTTSATINLTAPSQPGSYQFRYLLNNGYTSAAVSATVTVAGSAYSVTAGATTVAAGAALSVSWAAPSVHSAVDWVGLYRVNDPNTVYGWWQYTGAATSGNFNLTAPTQAGQYEFRYMLNNGYTDAARSAIVTVN